MTPTDYLLFYKPFEVLCKFSREGNKKNLADCLPAIAKDIYPVGRLDYDSEGLLLLTNDRAANFQLLHPSQQHERTYWVQVEGAITNEALMRLRDGVIIRIDGKQHQTLPARAQRLDPLPNLPPREPPIRFRQSIPDSWLALTLKEGKNRQVRRMTAAVGFPTLRLLRYSLGPLTIDGLQPGEWRRLTKEEQMLLFQKGIPKGLAKRQRH